ncbi:hypothetical protein BCR35DRAFT_327247 [Leucosporidium creatinivorum]|uniref:Cdc23 domain-containing protein n=1 Tax=Leucosporidium creatinivorum TaxID=106004 RepID=A0A1Y2CWG8_9BASI|nr:hypothetical protein BCR35DRAFT_327247 [Leucosporidium creatinivorum]
MSHPTIPQPDPAALRLELRTATQECMDRALNSSAKWAAELLSALPPTPSTSRDALPHSTAPGGSAPLFRTSTPVRHPPSTRQSLPGLPPMSSIAHGMGGHRDSLGSVLEMGSSPAHVMGGAAGEERMEEDHWTPEDEAAAEGRRQDEEERDMYLLALSYERTHEHMRAAHVLRDCTGPKARWLRGYAKYLAGEKRAQEENGELLGVKDKGVPNPFAQELLSEMATWEPGFIERDGWLLFLKALLLLSLPPLAPSPTGLRDPSSSLAGLDVRLLAMDTLVSSVKLQPYNWTAWLKIASCIEGPEELEATLKFLPQVPTFLFFFVHATLEIHAAGDNLHSVLDNLEAIFPGSSTIAGMRGLVHYHVREFDEATAFFTSLQQTDPYRVEDIDIFSNILYVSEKRAELAMLAQEYTKMDRSRPEVCCLVGASSNYYSLRREHEKAIIYFRRALKLDRGYLSAWTLMGHEYVEIKNTNAAIASYRRAVDVNRKDYRAWYGLGQTYELLGEPFYALNYYQKATALRPYDARMWSALAICYEKLKRVPDAIKAYQRALVSSEPGENDTSLRIGRLYALLGNSRAAAQYHRRALYEGLKTDASKAELSKIWLWLARWEMGREKEAGGQGEGGDLRLAEEYLGEVMSVQEDKEEAKALMKELNVLLLNRE